MLLPLVNSVNPEKEMASTRESPERKFASSALTKLITSITRTLRSFAVSSAKEARSFPEELPLLALCISVN